MGDTSETNTTENYFWCGNTKNAYTEKSLFARHGPFSQVLSHIYILKNNNNNNKKLRTRINKKPNWRASETHSSVIINEIRYGRHLSHSSFDLSITLTIRILLDCSNKFDNPHCLGHCHSY